jgi:hypothetical protein
LLTLAAASFRGQQSEVFDESKMQYGKYVTAKPGFRVALRVNHSYLMAVDARATWIVAQAS